MANIAKTAKPIVYFDAEGRQNLAEVLRALKKAIKKRSELQTLKIVSFTAEGQGPALAYSRLQEFSPRIIAVTFPRGFSIKGPNGTPYCPCISDNILKFFKGVEIDVVIPPRLPFDLIDGMEAHNQQMNLVRKTMAIFGTGFELCFQAVMSACDAGLVEQGETVIAFSGDTAGLIVASRTKHFLSAQDGLALQEIFCKPRRLTISRPNIQLFIPDSKTIEGDTAERRTVNVDSHPSE